MTKVVKARTRVYFKLTRALLRHLRSNGGRPDGRAQEMRSRRAQVLAKLIQSARAADTDEMTRRRVCEVLTGSIGINDQIDATLSGVADRRA